MLDFGVAKLTEGQSRPGDLGETRVALKRLKRETESGRTAVMSGVVAAAPSLTRTRTRRTWLVGAPLATVTVVAGLMHDQGALFDLSPSRAFSYVMLARAHAGAGRAAEARAAYDAFFEFWKAADPDATLLVQARAEYATLGT